MRKSVKFFLFILLLLGSAQLPFIQNFIIKSFLPGRASIETSFTGKFPLLVDVKYLKISTDTFYLNTKNLKLNIRLSSIFRCGESILQVVGGKVFFTEIKANTLKNISNKKSQKSNNQKSNNKLPDIFQILKDAISFIDSRLLPDIKLKEIHISDKLISNINLKRKGYKRRLTFVYKGKVQLVELSKGQALVHFLSKKTVSDILVENYRDKISFSGSSKLPGGLLKLSGHVLVDNSININLVTDGYLTSMKVTRKKDSYKGQITTAHETNSKLNLLADFSFNMEKVILTGNARLKSTSGNFRIIYNIKDFILGGSLNIKIKELSQLTYGLASGALTATLKNATFDLIKLRGNGSASIRAHELKLGKLDIQDVYLDLVGRDKSLSLKAGFSSDNIIPLKGIISADITNDVINIHEILIDIHGKKTSVQNVTLKPNKKNKFKGSLFGVPFRADSFIYNSNMKLEKANFICNKLPLSIFTIVFEETDFFGNLNLSASFNDKSDWIVSVNGNKLYWRDSRDEIKSDYFTPLDLDISFQNIHKLITLNLTDHKKNGVQFLVKREGEDSPLHFSIKGGIDINVIHALIPSDDRVGGYLDIDLKGYLDKENPRLSGEAILKNGFYENAIVGTLFKKIKAKINGKGKTLVIDTLLARDINNKPMHGDGFINFKNNSPQLLIQFHLKNNQIATSDMFKGKATGVIGLRGPLLRAAIFGDVLLSDTSLFLDDIDDDIVTLKDYKRRKKDKVETHKDIGMEYGLIIRTKDFDIHSKTIHSKWKGTLKLLGTTQKHFFNGKISVVNGDVEVFGKKCEFKKSSYIEYKKERPDMPWLNLWLEDVKSQIISVFIKVGGYANEMKVNFRSTPPMSEMDSLSMFLFGKTSGEISPFQGLELAAKLSAAKAGDSSLNFIGDLKKSLGVDIDFEEVPGEGENSRQSVSISKRLENGIKFGVKGGAGDGTNVLNISKEIFSNVTIGADFGQNSGVGIDWVKRY